MSELVADVGDQVRITAAFTDAVGAAADPGEVLVRIKSPSGDVALARWPTPGTGEGTVVKDAGLGAFHFDFTVTESGRWVYRCEGTGAVQSAEEATVYARKSAF